MDDLWSGPRVRAFMEELGHALWHGQAHCVLTLPGRHHPGFLAAFSNYARKAAYSVYILEPGPRDDLLTALQPAFCADEVNVTQPADLIRAHTRQEAAPILAVPRDFDLEVVERFVVALRDHAKGAMDRGEGLYWRMLFLVEPGAPMPKEDAGLRHFHWWGRLYPSDLEFAIEGEAQRQGLGGPALTWYSALCRGLCQMALELVAPIFASPPVNMEDVLELLAAHPLNNPQAAALALHCLDQGLPPAERTQLPAAQMLEAWRAGILDIGCHGRVQIHPGALLAAGRQNAIEQMVLSGQVQVYFPYVQEVIHLLQSRLDADLGPQWRQKAQVNVDEIGGLQHYFYALSQKTKRFEEEAKLAYVWWNIRNALAHHTMLEANLVLNGLAQYETLRR